MQRWVHCLPCWIRHEFFQQRFYGSQPAHVPYGVDWSHGTLLALLNTFILNSLSPLVGYRAIFQWCGCASIGLLWVHRVFKVFVSLFVYPVELVSSYFNKNVIVVNQHIYKWSGCKPWRSSGAPFNPLSPLAGYMALWDRSFPDQVGCVSIGLLSVMVVSWNLLFKSGPQQVKRSCFSFKLIISLNNIL